MHYMHYHHAVELYFCCHGEREYFIGDKFYTVGEGDIVLIPQDILHRTAGIGATRFLIYFSDAFLRRFFTGEILNALPIRHPFVFRPDEETRARIWTELNTMLSEYAEDTEQNLPRLAGRLCHLLVEMAASPNQYTSPPYADQRIGQIVRYINAHYGEIEDIQQIAERFFISKYHLCRTFNQSLGLPLISYLNTIKIRAAIALMHSEKLTLTDIALRCGFNSSSYFCKVFKAEKGVSPSAYRKQLRGK